MIGGMKRIAIATAFLALAAIFPVGAQENQTPPVLMFYYSVQALESAGIPHQIKQDRITLYATSESGVAIARWKSISGGQEEFEAFLRPGQSESLDLAEQDRLDGEVRIFWRKAMLAPEQEITYGYR